MAHDGSDIPLDRLPGKWQTFLEGGQVLTALLLSTSFSEKYKGRHMHPGGKDTCEVLLPTASEDHRSTRPRLLQRFGNKEAVAFVWLGDEKEDRTLYVAFSPARFLTQGFKIFCAGMAHDAPRSCGVAESAAGRGSGGAAPIPISTYVHAKLKRMWGQQGLWKSLSALCDEYREHRVVFAGISHGAALAQAAALQFRVRKPEADVFSVTWNTYRWTNEVGSEIARRELGDRMLCFVLSRRGHEPCETRYWDTMAELPRGFAPMQKLVLLDADNGKFFQHVMPDEPPSCSGALALMRIFELHFAKAAITATRKSMSHAIGASGDMAEAMASLGKPIAEKLQEKVLGASERVARTSSQLRRVTSAELDVVRRTLELTGERMWDSKVSAVRELAIRKEEKRSISCFSFLSWCGRPARSRK